MSLANNFILKASGIFLLPTYQGSLTEIQRHIDYSAVAASSRPPDRICKILHGRAELLVEEQIGRSSASFSVLLEALHAEDSVKHFLEEDYCKFRCVSQDSLCNTFGAKILDNMIFPDGLCYLQGTS